MPHDPEITPEPGIQNSSEPATQPSEPAEKKLAELETKLKDQESKYAYLYAEFENFKKRAIKERSDLLKYGWESAARDLLQVVDNLERAVEHAPQGTDQALTQGLQMVLSQFNNTLEKQGIRTVETLGKPFDPNFEEAVAQQPSDEPDGTVIKEHSRGYTLHGRLLRPARVVVSTGKPNGS